LPGIVLYLPGEFGFLG